MGNRNESLQVNNKKITLLLLKYSSVSFILQKNKTFVDFNSQLLYYLVKNLWGFILIKIMIRDKQILFDYLCI